MAYYWKAGNKQWFVLILLFCLTLPYYLLQLTLQTNHSMVSIDVLPQLMSL